MFLVNSAPPEGEDLGATVYTGSGQTSRNRVKKITAGMTAAVYGMAGVFLLFFSLFAGQLGLAANAGLAFVFLIGLLALLLGFLAVIEAKRFSNTSPLRLHERGLELPIPKALSMKPFSFAKSFPFVDISWMTRMPLGWEIVTRSGTFYVQLPVSPEDEKRLADVAERVRMRGKT